MDANEGQIKISKEMIEGALARDLKFPGNPSQFFIKGRKDASILILHGYSTDVQPTELFFKYFKIKGFTIARPQLITHQELITQENCHPEHWLENAESWLLKLAETEKNIYILGLSLGGNLAISLAAKHKKIIKGVILVETPIFFKFKFRFFLSAVKPIFEFFKISHVKSNKFWYRKNYQQDKDDPFPYLPLKTVGRINNFIINRTRKELSLIDIPVLVIQALKSDLLNITSADYILGRVKSVKKEKYVLSVDNHDLNIMDDENKILALGAIYKFISSI
jgi:carboxylesterase